ncbi:Ubiquitin fusion degradation protein 4 [Sporothrix stenoceras]|uniref:HECT-type E3 ubiquitin transferase n=1 Tax=Sporothrix stenoceras TaxID=5173 RepID=A0ABR3YID7_9PEZI
MDTAMSGADDPSSTTGDSTDKPAEFEKGGSQNGGHENGDGDGSDDSDGGGDEVDEDDEDDEDAEDNDNENNDEDEDEDDDDDDDDNDDEDDDGEDDDGEDDDDEDDDDGHRYSESGLSDPFHAGFAGSHRGSGLPAALSMLGGMLSMSGMGGRLREILNNLRRKEDPSMQLIALQDLSEILLVSNEDNLIGSFSPDPYVRELVALMQPNEITGEENPDMMLLACRCLANLMEAIPASAANVVFGGAVPVLCQKLLEISFIDLAEQALSTLEKISVEYPSRIVQEGGLTACLSYLEFFATSTQRTAVTTAANCCRNIPVDSFPVVRDVMPILLNVLNSNDQRVVEQAALCVSRIVESFKHYPLKLEELVGVDLLKAILRLLLPGSTNHFIGPNLHTQFLRVLAITANDSPRLAAELFKMSVVETLYQNLTGVSPPVGVDDIAAKLDSALIMQALIHRPREQIIETLNVVCNLLPTEVAAAPVDSVALDIPGTVARDGDIIETNEPSSMSEMSVLNEKRLEFLSECQEEVRRFTLILLPTLTDAYSSTVNLDVRTRVLAAQIKMLSNFDRDIILEALKAVPFASFLASILSQQDHPALVGYALQATELLMSRLGDVYRYQLYREGVIGEIEKIAAIEDDGHPSTLPAHSDQASEIPGFATHETGNRPTLEIGIYEQRGSLNPSPSRGHKKQSLRGRDPDDADDGIDRLSSDAGLELENKNGHGDDIGDEEVESRGGGDNTVGGLRDSDDRDEDPGDEVPGSLERPLEQI